MLKNKDNWLIWSFNRWLISLKHLLLRCVVFCRYLVMIFLMVLSGWRSSQEFIRWWRFFRVVRIIILTFRVFVSFIRGGRFFVIDLGRYLLGRFQLKLDVIFWRILHRVRVMPWIFSGNFQWRVFRLQFKLIFLIFSICFVFLVLPRSLTFWVLIQVVPLLKLDRRVIHREQGSCSRTSFG